MPLEILQKSWLISFIILAMIWYAFGFAGFKVQEDARKRGLGKAAVTFWSVSIVFFGPIFLPLYLLFRSRAVFATGSKETPRDSNVQLCPHCGESNPDQNTRCSKCNQVLGTTKPVVGTKACPYCGADNPVDASRCASCDQVIGLVIDDDD